VVRTPPRSCRPPKVFPSSPTTPSVLTPFDSAPELQGSRQNTPSTSDLCRRHARRPGPQSWRRWEGTSTVSSHSTQLPQSHRHSSEADLRCRESPHRDGRLEDTRRNPHRGRQLDQPGTLSPARSKENPHSPAKTLTRNVASYQVLSNASERIIREEDDSEASEEIPLGLYLVRGDNVCSVGLVDEKLDDSIDWTRVKGSAIGGVKHI
jgi:hypothetical protein